MLQLAGKVFDNSIAMHPQAKQPERAQLDSPLGKLARPTKVGSNRSHDTAGRKRNQSR
jgi:hypothetical protein